MLGLFPASKEFVEPHFAVETILVNRSSSFWLRRATTIGDRFTAAIHESLLLRDEADEPDPRMEVAGELIDEWLAIVTQQAHAVPELVDFARAWHWSIDQVDHSIASNGYTFSQLDDFLTRYGWGFFPPSRR